MFNKESGNLVEECKLRVVYVPPPQPPSPVSEGSEEGSSPRASLSENGNLNNSDSTAVSRGSIDLQEKSSEVSFLVLNLQWFFVNFGSCHICLIDMCCVLIDLMHIQRFFARI
ncbi:Vesicle-associated protein 1-1 [Thalictrum thalictroides]|uniref:Vesicle-associated protein 1-1 n=1 Tax=Thalictrum thalictroides TaxID=46969 RepID=A0A7J6V575_THATH|nr:Vesicle-associated protein 1-1 [Thalictrum thalictroides]